MKFQCDTQGKKITITPDCILRTKKRYRGLACAVAAIMEREELSRRDFADWLAEELFGFDGQIVLPDGSGYLVRDTLIDDVFSGDGSFRWISELVKFAVSPPRQRPQRRILRRLRAIDLAIRIACPDWRTLFGT